jgi:hypothetical protein
MLDLDGEVKIATPWIHGFKFKMLILNVLESLTRYNPAQLSPTPSRKAQIGTRHCSDQSPFVGELAFAKPLSGLLTVALNSLLECVQALVFELIMQFV